MNLSILPRKAISRSYNVLNRTRMVVAKVAIIWLVCYVTQTCFCRFPLRCSSPALLHTLSLVATITSTRTGISFRSLHLACDL
eukprot:scaffold128331_cov43-Prasinocladus_malaysianus.AAC.4